MSEDRAEYVHVNPEDLRRLRREHEGEMSEDPVKYEPLKEEWSGERLTESVDAGKDIPAHVVRDILSSIGSGHSQRLRVEALRAAVHWTHRVDHVTTDDVKKHAKQFAAYLESGE